MNTMRDIRIEKLTLNICTGKDQDKLEKGVKLLHNLTGLNPVKTVTNKRIAGWGLRPGLPIGAKITLRNERAHSMLLRTLDAKSHVLRPSQFDPYGTLSFGISEYIDIKQANYDPDIGILGLEVCVTLERPGFRIKRRRLRSKKVPNRHRISKEDAMHFMQNKFNVKIEEE
jgi:large subunit ribosomal protein L5